MIAARRGSIKVDRWTSANWSRLVAEAERRAIEGITFEALAKMAERRKEGAAA